MKNRTHPIPGKEPAPAASPGNDHFLGSPDVVARLVGEFCAGIEALLHQLGAGVISKEAFTSSGNALIQKYADICSGRNPEYRIIPGYHDRALKQKLKPDLGEFWQKQRAKWNDDSVCCLFEWLAVTLAEKIKIAGDEDWFLEIMIKPSVQQVVKLILGIEKRVGL